MLCLLQIKLLVHLGSLFQAAYLFIYLFKAAAAPTTTANINHISKSSQSLYTLLVTPMSLHQWKFPFQY